jgi:capsular polysaccharide biosynthesis protein
MKATQKPLRGQDTSRALSTTAWMPPTISDTSRKEAALQVQPVTESNKIVEPFQRLQQGKMAAFYRRYLRKNPLIRRYGFTLFRKLYVTIAFPYKLLYSRITASPTWYKLQSLRNYVEAHSLPITIRYDETAIHADAPIFYPPNQLFMHQEKKFPAIFVTQIPDATVYGASNIISAGQMAIHHDLFDVQTDFTAEEMHCRQIIAPHQSHLLFLSVRRSAKTLDEAAVFLDACSSNYAHWLSEVLPRIHAFCADSNTQDIPLLIDADLHPNLLESIEAITNGNRTIILVPIAQAVTVRKLYVTSVAGYVPYDRRTRSVPVSSDGLFSSPALHAMREKILEHIKKAYQNDTTLRGWPKRLYLRRNSRIRTITNNDALEALVAAYGYAIIEPEKLSFLQQVALFAQAEHVIGATGAAIANALFMPNGAKLCVLTSQHKRILYGYWNSMLCPFDIKLHYLLGDVAQNDFMQGHADFYAPLEVAEKMLHAWHNK